MSKSKLMAVIALSALFGLPAAAHASVLTATPAPIGSISNLHAGEDDGGDNGEDHQGSRDESENSGGQQGDKDDSFVVPPVVVHPPVTGSTNSGTGSTGTGTGAGKGLPTGAGTVPITSDDVSETGSYGLPAISGGNPQTGEAIQVDRVIPSSKTPTDLFVDTAVLGLGAIGSGALVLGGVVGVRAIKARRSGEKFDYFYGRK